MNVNRRDFFAGITFGTAALLLNGGRSAQILSMAGIKTENNKEPDVSATEDLMREHGILRRALFVYSESADRLISNPSKVSAEALNKTALLFRAFGEDYHEKKLEETYIFPALKRAGGKAAAYVGTLIVQHNRGRQITDYILAVTQTPKLEISDAQSLAAVLKSMTRMYRPHAALEDTIIFPAWKTTCGAKQLDEMSDRFEQIEHQQFGKDGFENAVKQIAAIEDLLAMSDLSQFTAPAPP